MWSEEISLGSGFMCAVKNVWKNNRAMWDLVMWKLLEAFQKSHKKSEWQVLELVSVPSGFWNDVVMTK